MLSNFAVKSTVRLQAFKIAVFSTLHKGHRTSTLGLLSGKASCFIVERLRIDHPHNDLCDSIQVTKVVLVQKESCSALGLI
jgi:hypothetical protein